MISLNPKMAQKVTLEGSIFLVQIKKKLVFVSLYLTDFVGQTSKWC